MLDLWNEEVLRPRLVRNVDIKHYYKSMFQSYTDILNAYNTFKLIFKHFVSNLGRKNNVATNLKKNGLNTQ